MSRGPRGDSLRAATVSRLSLTRGPRCGFIGPMKKKSRIHGMTRFPFALILLFGCFAACGEGASGGVDNPDAGICSADRKLCETAPGVRKCVPRNDQGYGCATESCVPCGLSHASTFRCTPEGQCGVGSCVARWMDCDNDPANGCETNLDTDLSNCNSCGMACTPGANVMSSRCSAGVCRVDTCQPGYLDCDLIAANGCEANLMACPRDQ